MHVNFAVGDANGDPSHTPFTVEVTTEGSGTLLYSYSSTLDQSTYALSSVTFFDEDDANGELAFNSLQIGPQTIPEPTGAALLGLSGLMGLVLRRRR